MGALACHGVRLENDMKARLQEFQNKMTNENIQDVEALNNMTCLGRKEKKKKKWQKQRDARTGGRGKKWEALFFIFRFLEYCIFWFFVKVRLS